MKTTETGELWGQSLRLTEITRKLKAEAGNATHFVVFDACRNTLRLTQPGSRAIVQSKGFIPVAQENGILIAYATAEGELASDVGAGAEPYAKVLAEEIVKRMVLGLRLSKQDWHVKSSSRRQVRRRNRPRTCMTYCHRQTVPDATFADRMRNKYQSRGIFN